ncbi:MAG: amidohydrolase [Clostridia bacterium]|nr:amidohydrolase [Clostridia bacterium]
MAMHDVRNLKAIDSHLHFEHFPKYENEMQLSDRDTIWKVASAANVDKLFISTMEAVSDVNMVESENDYLWNLSQELDYLYQWVVIDPRNENTFLQAKRMLDHGKCVGIKLHPKGHNYTLAEFGDKIFSFASDFGAIVQIHPEDSATWILPHADQYPDVTFIVAHMCSWLGRAYADAIERAKHGNVWTDTSGMASFYNQGVEYIVNRVGADKILYGSDGYAAGFQRGRIEYAQISDEDKVKILRLNAERLFAKTFAREKK